MPRGLSKDFLSAMREKMESGRYKGRVGWDTHWDCSSWGPLEGPHGELMQGLLREVTELVIALERNHPIEIREEAADVANYAMMIADIHNALDTKPEP